MATDATLSDWDVFDEAFQPLLVADDARLDALYEAFLPIDEARTGAFRQMLLGGAIAFLSTFGILATAGNAILGLSIKPEYFAATAVVYATVCYLHLTNVDLKRRLYERLFKRIFEEADHSRRAGIALRYPAAFPGSLFTATSFKRSDQIVDWRQAGSLAGLIFLLLATFGAGLTLWGYTLATLWSAPDGCFAETATVQNPAGRWIAWQACRAGAERAGVIVRAVIVAHLVAVAGVRLIHRNPTAKRRYERISAADA